MYFLTGIIIRKSIGKEMDKIRNELAASIPQICVGTWFENIMPLRPNSLYNKSINFGLEPTNVKLFLQAYEDRNVFAEYEIDHQGIMRRSQDGIEFERIEKMYFGKSIILLNIKLNKDKLILSFKNIDKDNMKVLSVLVRWEATKENSLLLKKNIEVDLSNEV